MNRVPRMSRYLVPVLILTWIFASAIGISEAGKKNLFVAAPGVQMQDAVSNDPTVVRQRPVGIDASAMPDAAAGSVSLTFNLFDDVSLTGVLDQTIKNPSGTISYVGHISGADKSNWTIVKNGDNIFANVHTLAGTYQVRFDESGNHVAREIDVSKFPEGDDAIPVNNPPETESDRRKVKADSGGTIDVMVVYTASARSAAGGTTAMNTLIDLAVTETNTAYSNSNVTQRIRLVYKGEVTYTESGFSSALNAITSTTDGNMDEVHTLRNTYAADEVILLINNTSSCGIAWLMTSVSSSFAPNAFGVVEQSCATGNYSFGHELGHNMGLRHDVYVDTGTTPYSYAHGYVSPNFASSSSDRWRTVMAYNDKCAASGLTCTRVQYFSNPSKAYTTGTAMGDSQADNRTALNNTAATVANFRDSSTSTTTPTVAFSSSSGSGSESTATVTIPVTLSASSSSTVTVNYSVSGTATGGGVDYTLSSGTLTFTAGTTSQDITLTIVDDLTLESSETVIITLSSPSNASLGTNTTFTYTITDDEISSASAFANPSAAQRVVSPYWQADSGIYTLVSVSHPSLSGMNSQIGVQVYAVNKDGSTLYGSAASFTLTPKSTKRMIITISNHSWLNSTNVPDAAFITGNASGNYGSLVFQPVATTPSQCAVSLANHCGFRDITSLTFWGAVVVSSTATGFAMEFVGDRHDSIATGSNNIQGVSGGGFVQGGVGLN